MKIKIEKHTKNDLITDKDLFQVGAPYQIISGEDTGKIFTLSKIYWDEKDKAYILDFEGEHLVNANFADSFIKKESEANLISCPHCKKWICR